ncbi:MAG: MerR family transcriptional regulator [Bacteroidia bacterium]
MAYKEKEIQRLFYSIGDVAKMFNVNTSLIRFYENEFDILKPAKNQKGNRFFTPKDVESFKIIFHLVKDLGFTLEGAKKKLTEDKTEVMSDHELRETLTRLRSFLVELKEKL